MARRRRKKAGVFLTPPEVEKMREAGRFAASLLDEVETMIEPGLTTAAIDAFVQSASKKRGARSATLGYTGGGPPPVPRPLLYVGQPCGLPRYSQPQPRASRWRHHQRGRDPGH